MNTIYIKENGVTRTSDEERKKEETKAVLINKMNIFDFTDDKGTTLTNKSLKTYTSYLDYLTRLDFKELMDRLQVFTYRVVTATSESDLTDGENSLYSIIKESLHYYMQPQKFSFRTRLNKKNDVMVFEDKLLVMITVAKETIKRYIKAYLENYTEDQLADIDKKIKNGANPLDYIEINDVKFSNIEDESLKAFSKSILNYYLSEKVKSNVGYKHLCGDCSCPILDCPKILDDPKKNIDEYDFIIDGQQKVHTEMNPDPNDPVYTGDVIEVVDEFLVTNCKKFFKTPPKEDKNKIKRVHIVK